VSARITVKTIIAIPIGIISVHSQVANASIASINHPREDKQSFAAKFSFHIFTIICRFAYDSNS
jgi:hypothetical protein